MKRTMSMKRTMFVAGILLCPIFGCAKPPGEPAPPPADQSPRSMEILHKPDEKIGESASDVARPGNEEGGPAVVPRDNVPVPAGGK